MRYLFTFCILLFLSASTQAQPLLRLKAIARDAFTNDSSRKYLCDTLSYAYSNDRGGYLPNDMIFNIFAPPPVVAFNIYAPPLGGVNRDRGFENFGRMIPGLL